jgi:hypothetical protein
VQDLRGPPVVGSLVRPTARGEDRIGTDQIDIPLGGVDRCVWMQRDWVAVPHPRFLGERGPYVVVEGAMVAAVIPLAAQRLRKLNHLGGLQGCPALVGQPQRLVVDVLVDVAQALEDSTTSPLPHTGQVWGP